MAYRFACFLLAATLAIPAAAFAQDQRQCVSSPSEILTFCVEIDSAGAVYDVARGGQPLIARSLLGLVLSDRPDAPVEVITAATRASRDETWEQPWGEHKATRDQA